MSVPGPTLGPCVSWISGSDVSCPGSLDAAVLNTAALEASMALYEISGRQFSGLCSQHVRPTRDLCQCWGPSSMGLGPWYWSANAWGVGAWGWANEVGDRLGCQPLSLVLLPGYPVREILEVKIDGVVLPALDGNGNPNYRLDRWRELVRMGDPGPPFQARKWPGCQNLDLGDDQDGTFSIKYQWGVDPPPLGKDAAAQLACQIALALHGAECQLPTGTTRVTRQGVQIERGLLANWFDPKQGTGLVAVDMFLKAYWRQRGSRRGAVFSPDAVRYARRMTP